MSQEITFEIVETAEEQHDYLLDLFCNSPVALWRLTHSDMARPELIHLPPNAIIRSGDQDADLH